MGMEGTNEAPTYFQEYVSNGITSFPSADNQESTFRNLKEMLSDHSEKYQAVYCTVLH